MAIDLKAIDLKQLKEEIKALNETGSLEKKIKVVGTSKENLIEAFKTAIFFLDDSEIEIPESATNFFNANLSEEAGAGEEPEKKEPTKRKPPTPSKKIQSFDDLQGRLKEPSNPTSYMDKLMLKGGKIETLIAKLKEYLEANEIDFSGFRTVSSVKRHIQYRQEHNWEYEIDGDKVKLIGFKVKK